LVYGPTWPGQREAQPQAVAPFPPSRFVVLQSGSVRPWLFFLLHNRHADKIVIPLAWIDLAAFEIYSRSTTIFTTCVQVTMVFGARLAPRFDESKSGIDFYFSYISSCGTSEKMIL